MIHTNTINKGLYQGVNKAYQPEGTVIANHNGHFIHYDEGNFVWKSAKGNKLVDITIDGTTDKFESLLVFVMAIDFMNNDLIILGRRFDSADYIGRVVFTSKDFSTGTYYHIVNGEDLELERDTPIRQFICSYENENIQRVYWNDGVKSPRALNIADVPSPISAELLNFTPPSDIGIISYDYEIAGSLYMAVYSIVFRLSTNDGAVTDYSIPTLPISVNKKQETGNLSPYNQIQNQGGNFTEISEVGLALKVSNIDVRYDNIQVVAFRSIAKDVYEPGTLIFDQEITSSEMTFQYRGNENLGQVTSDELNVTSRFIIQAQLMEFIQDLNTLADFKQRTEIPEGTNIKYNKILGVTLDKEMYSIPLDSRVEMSKYNKSTDTLDDKPLVAVDAESILYKNVWYYRNSEVRFLLGDGITTKIQGDDIAYIRIKKYQEAGGTIIYENISLEDQYLNYRSKKVSERLRGYMGTETYRYSAILWKDGKPYGARWIGDLQFPVRSSWWEMATLYTTDSGYSLDHLMGNIMSLIVNNLDLTELVTVADGVATDCSIDGFSIVRAKRDEQILSEGILTPILESSSRSILAAPATHQTNNTRRQYAYSYYSPETMFNVPDKQLAVGDKLRVHTYMGALSSDNDYYGPDTVGDANNWAQKYYTDQLRPSIDLPEDGEENIIKAVYDFAFNSEGEDDLAIPELGIVIRNEAETPGGKDGYGTDTKVVVTTTNEVSDENSFASWNHNAVSIIDHVRPKTNLYGGTSDAALAGNTYYSTGHYQEITLDILNAIKTGTSGNEKFEFNNIQIFGGDTFINIFPLHRILRNQFKSDPDFFSLSMIFPIQSTVNIDMRTGNEINRERAYHSSKNPNGIGLEGSYIKLEDFNYNDAYSTSIGEKIYLPLPFGYKEVSESLFDIIWSNKKIIGEKIDNYRIFPVNNTRAVEHSFGKLIFTAASKNKLIYLQENGVGYIPINERISINSAENQPVQLGIGGVFDRYDTTEKFYGCQHYFSATKVPNGIVFFDFNRRAFIMLKDNMQLSDDSIIKGLEPFFNDLSISLRDNDSPHRSYGILSYYDEKRKEVVMAFKEEGGRNQAITFNNKLGFFTGTIDLITGLAKSKLGFTFVSPGLDYGIYINDLGDDRDFFGTKYPAYIKFVVNNQRQDNKTFDNWKVIGNDNFFNSIIYTGKNFEITEGAIVDNSGNILSDYLDYVNFEWEGSYPIADDGERLRGHYAEVQLGIDVNNESNIELLEFITLNRKAF